MSKFKFLNVQNSPVQESERVNGIFKDEFMLGETLRSFQIAKELVKQSIEIYNKERLHTSLNYQTPEYRYRHAA